MAELEAEQQCRSLAASLHSIGPVKRLTLSDTSLDLTVSQRMLSKTKSNTQKFAENGVMSAAHYPVLLERD